MEDHYNLIPNWYYFHDEPSESLSTSTSSAAPISEEEDVRHSIRRIRVKLSPELEPSSLHKCKHCNKSFTSGKALGGHVSSAHVQSTAATKKISSAATGSIKCKECGKGFRTEKSLHGHMRSHPERPFRGMEPPPPPSPVAASSSSAGIGSMSWPRGTKRGRGPLGAIRPREDANVAFEGNEVSKKLGRLRKLGQDWYEGVKELLLLPTRGIPHVTCTCDVCNQGFHSKKEVKIDDKIGFDLNMMPEEDEHEE